MTTENIKHGTQAGKPFIAFEVSLKIISSLRGVVGEIRRHDAKLAQQIVASASSVAANLAEGNKRLGRDKTHLFSIAAGSANETRAHLRVAQAWGWVRPVDIELTLRLLDQELAMLWRL